MYDTREKIENRYRKLSDKELSREYVKHDKIIMELLNDAGNDISDEYTVLLELISERFVAQCDIGLVWNDSAQDWVSPDWHKVIQDMGFKKIDYWIQ